MERLLTFRAIIDRPEVQHTLVELRTSKDTYYDIWGFDYGLDEFGYCIRVYDTNVIQWCKDKNININKYI